MPQLDQNAIHHINEWLRFSHLADTAHRADEYAHGATFARQALEKRNQVTDDQIGAYRAAGILPPCAVGAYAHRRIVARYLAATR